MKPLAGLTLVAAMLAGCNKAPQPPTPAAERPSAPTSTSQGAPQEKAAESTVRSASPAQPEAEAAAPNEGSGQRPARKSVSIDLTLSAADELSKLRRASGARYVCISVTPDHRYEFTFEKELHKFDYLGQPRLVPFVADRKSRHLLPAKLMIDAVNSNGRTAFTFVSADAEPEARDLATSLVAARRGFPTKLPRQVPGGKPAPEPPPDVFRLVRYESPAGKLTAYLTPDPENGQRHPAILWITGGDNSLGEGCWKEGLPQDDQSAIAYRKAGIAMMFPSLRGTNDHPGPREGFWGEVDDVLAAADYLARQEFVDPQRIYLGGHSTGGTLALLVAECSDRFRAVFSFGPVHDVSAYVFQHRHFPFTDQEELRLRAPSRWLHSIRGNVFVFEGMAGNIVSLQAMARSSQNPLVRFFPIKGASHFTVLSATNRLIAEKILTDTGPTCSLAFTEEELNKPFEAQLRGVGVK